MAFENIMIMADSGLDGLKNTVNDKLPRADSVDLGSILAWVFSLAGIAAVIGIVVSGVFYANARGDASQVQRAKSALIFSLIGLMIVLLSAAIAAFVISSAGSAG